MKGHLNFLELAVIVVVVELVVAVVAAAVVVVAVGFEVELPIYKLQFIIMIIFKKYFDKSHTFRPPIKSGWEVLIYANSD